MDKDSPVTWHDNGRGPRLLIKLAGEEIVIDLDAARRLRNALIVALDEIGALERPTA